MSINILDQNTINKIAAGEVVERPSSVVKELVENAIDAGSNAVTIEIKDGGTSLIRITDNGCGISNEDVKIAFLRHATSKIKQATDLMNVSSLGFRGEALSSISAVSQVELITKTKDSFVGIRYCMDGGIEKIFEEAGAPDGTTFLIRNLFYNTPARRKFLKTNATEAGYISNVVEQLCMSHPEVSFRFIVNGKPKIQTMGNSKLKDVIYTIYGRDITSHLLEINFQTEDMKINGYIGEPVISRGNRNFENYYINGRYIKSDIISKAIEDAYAPFMMQHKYPFTAFHIVINPELLDVNVHPTKMELRFSNQNELYNAIEKTVKDSLSHKELIPEIEVTLQKEAEDHQPIQEVKQKEIPTSQIKMPEPFEEKRALAFKETIPPVVYEQSELFEKKELLKQENKKDIRIIGQVFETYWIMEFDKNMYIVDQHAAHEKVLFERIMKAYNNRTIQTQQISPPIIITPIPSEIDLLKENLTHFTSLGFEIEDFGKTDFAIRGIPSEFSQGDPKEIMLEVLDSLSSENKNTTQKTIYHRIATMACKAAVKGNNHLSYPEAQALISELMDLDQPYHCPHGRPTMITMSNYELEKKFNRIV